MAEEERGPLKVLRQTSRFLETQFENPCLKRYYTALLKLSWLHIIVERIFYFEVNGSIRWQCTNSYLKKTPHGAWYLSSKPNDLRAKDQTATRLVIFHFLPACRALGKKEVERQVENYTYAKKHFFGGQPLKTRQRSNDTK